MELEVVLSFPNNNKYIHFPSGNILLLTFQIIPILRTGVLGCNASLKCILETKYFNYETCQYIKDEVAGMKMDIVLKKTYSGVCI